MVTHERVKGAKCHRNAVLSSGCRGVQTCGRRSVTYTFGITTQGPRTVTDSEGLQQTSCVCDGTPTLGRGAGVTAVGNTTRASGRRVRHFGETCYFYLKLENKDGS
jgi:hypothetical protein